MKKAILFIPVMLFGVLHAQQKPYYTQYILNNYILNPALTGIENYTDIRLSCRSQWQGISGAPFTAYVSVHAPLGKKDFRTTATSFSIPGENPRGRSYWEGYTAAAPHHGLGMMLVNDRTGFMNRSSGYITYAYHLGISPKTSLAAGFMGGVTNIRIDRDKIDWASLNPNDPAMEYANGPGASWQPEVGAGIWLYSADYFAGASVQNIVPSKTRFSNNSNYGEQLQPHYFATAGYRFLLNDDINALPSVMVKYVSPLAVQYDINIKCQYMDLFWMGGSYRIKELFGGWSAMAGVNIQGIANISYAYDISTSRLGTFSRGSHEIMVGFLLGNNYGDSCPRNVW